MAYTFDHVQIDALQGSHSKTLISVPEFLVKFIPENKIKKTVKALGFESVSYLPNKYAISDLLIPAAKNVLDKTHTDAQDIDALIVVSQSFDYTTPATSYIIQDKLGLRESCIVMDLVQGCSGFVQGLFQASVLIESKIAKKVLVLAGDTSCNKDYIRDDTPQPANSAIFGDGGSACLLSYTETQNRSVYSITNKGSLHNVIVSTSCATKLVREKNYDFCYKRDLDIIIDGIALADFIFKEGAESIKDVLNKFNVSLEDIAFCVVHQANKNLLAGLAMALNVSTLKVPFLAQKIGNTSSASIPLALSYMDEAQRKELLEKPTLLSGFGVGMSVASAIVNLNKTIILKPFEF